MALESEVFHVLYNRKKFHTSIYKKFNSEYSDRALESEVFHVLYNRKKFHTSKKNNLILKIQTGLSAFFKCTSTSLFTGGTRYFLLKFEQFS
jgi:hypothetical protein